MITKCKFDKSKDIEQVVPDLSISIEMALATGIVKDTADSTPYSKMTSTDQVGSYLTDAIDIAMANNRLQGVIASQMSSAASETNPE